MKNNNCNNDVMQKICCPNCFQQSVCINSKCEFCKENVIAKYNKNTKSQIGCGIFLSISGFIFVNADETLYAFSAIMWVLATICFLFALVTIFGLGKEKNIIANNTRIYNEIKEREEKEKQQIEKAKIEREKAKETLLKQMVEKQEQYAAYRKETEIRCLEYIIKNPIILLLYNDILNEFNRYSESSEKNSAQLSEIEKIFFTKENFKTLFFDFLIASEADLEENNLTIELYRSKLILDNYKYIETFETWLDETGIRFNVNENIETLVRSQTTKKGASKNSRKVSLNDLENYVKDINLYAYKFKFHIEFYENVYKPFIANEELMKIYNNLKNGKCDKEYIVEKIYSLYQVLYKDVTGKKITKEDIEKIIVLIEKDEPKKINIKEAVNIKTKQQLVNYMVNDIDKMLEKDVIYWIVKILNETNNMEKEDKIDIVRNIDEVSYKIISKRELKEKIASAEKERDRLLKGDLSKEQKVAWTYIKDDEELKRYIINIYSDLGYKVCETDLKKDAIVVQKGNTKYLILFKCSEVNVGVKIVKEMLKLKETQKVSKGIIATNNLFTKQAIEQAKENKIQLVDKIKLKEYANKILEK
ncbi:MAG: restriction endonuclease [Clostridia bacterium]|nr:restriction endonuclease [Clostridia bacterium]